MSAEAGSRSLPLIVVRPGGGLNRCAGATVLGGWCDEEASLALGLRRRKESLRTRSPALDMALLAYDQCAGTANQAKPEVREKMLGETRAPCVVACDLHTHRERELPNT